MKVLISFNCENAMSSYRTVISHSSDELNAHITGDGVKLGDGNGVAHCTVIGLSFRLIKFNSPV